MIINSINTPCTTGLVYCLNILRASWCNGAIIVITQPIHVVFKVTEYKSRQKVYTYNNYKIPHAVKTAKPFLLYHYCRRSNYTPNSLYIRLLMLWYISLLQFNWKNILRSKSHHNCCRKSWINILHIYLELYFLISKYRKALDNCYKI